MFNNLLDSEFKKFICKQYNSIKKLQNRYIIKKQLLRGSVKMFFSIRRVPPLIF